MAISPIMTGNSQNTYMPEPKSVREYPDRKIYIYEEPGSNGRKVGVGIASYFLPGLGQAINGQWGKAVGFAGGFYGGALLLSASTIGLASFASMKRNASKLSALGMIGLIAGGLGLFGLKIWSIVDAVKNAKKEREITVMNNAQ